MTFNPDCPHGHVTRDGEKTVAVFRDKNKAVVAVFDWDGGLTSRVYYANGRWRADGVDSGLDLINASAPKRKLEAWVNVYSDGQPIAHRTRAQADKYCDNNRIACLHVTGEEGDGL